MCISLGHFNLQVVDTMIFQPKCSNKSSIYFQKRLFCHIKILLGPQITFHFTLKNGFFLITHILEESLIFIDYLDVVCSF